MELYYYLLREEGEEKADFYYNYYLPACVSVSDKIIKEAMKFKLKFKNKRLSYVDCVGYIFSLELGIKFLTGDKEFKSFRNVEYVK
jgi:predicted nucleic acid-binding protein